VSPTTVPGVSNAGIDFQPGYAPGTGTDYFKVGEGPTPTASYSYTPDPRYGTGSTNLIGGQVPTFGPAAVGTPVIPPPPAGVSGYVQDPGFFESLRSGFAPGGLTPLQGVRQAFLPARMSIEQALATKGLTLNTATQADLELAESLIKLSSPGVFRSYIPPLVAGGLALKVAGGLEPGKQPDPVDFYGGKTARGMLEEDPARYSVGVPREHERASLSDISALTAYPYTAGVQAGGPIESPRFQAERIGQEMSQRLQGFAHGGGVPSYQDWQSNHPEIPDMFQYYALQQQGAAPTAAVPAAVPAVAAVPATNTGFTMFPGVANTATDTGFGSLQAAGQNPVTGGRNVSTAVANTGPISGAGAALNPAYATAINPFTGLPFLNPATGTSWTPEEFAAAYATTTRGGGPNETYQFPAEEEVMPIEEEVMPIEEEVMPIREVAPPNVSIPTAYMPTTDMPTAYPSTAYTPTAYTPTTFDQQAMNTALQGISQPGALFQRGGPIDYPPRVGPIYGPGTGTSDDVPAMLSDGEYVMTADAVRGAGNGNRQRGMRNMYDMMRQFEGRVV